ncbi:MAG: ribosomal protein S19 [Candidatus Xenolissoclinum pacificiensis L6]|uniref:Small ribosomal subunit protein uS19 n=1 Tax=Candidatus Xenolissoclinum pacificiensis L6 TaxID=1401685 RepID=W2UZP4_9RICK|nr:MAG: ribosomal protein S19 [Candidatus Xenolissoclinum pacificiensis L6]
MARSVWKGPFCDNSLFRALRKYKNKEISYIKTRSRSSVVLIDFIGCWIHVYNGKKYVPVKISENMVGYKLGEFAPTRTFTGHSGNRKAVRK